MIQIETDLIQKLVSDTDGELHHVLLFAPAYEAKDFELIYTSLIEQLPPNTEVTVVTVPDAVEKVELWATLRPAACLKTIAVDLDITPWSRDPHWVASVAEQTTLFSSPSLQRRNDPATTQLIADAIDAQRQDFGAAFEGGNSLISGSHLFIGSDTLLAQRGGNLEEKRASFLSALSASGFDGSNLVVLGNPDVQCPQQLEAEIVLGGQPWQEISYYSNGEGTTQPIFHIDYYVTPLPNSDDGQPRIMVGDSQLAAELLGQDLHPAAQADALNAVANQLVGLGFDVIRNPLPLIYMDEIEQWKRAWFFASSNNVLQQASANSGNIVWLPQYGHDNWAELSITDQANAEVWQNLGYEVRFIPDCQRLAENMGGLHCMTSVLKRAESSATLPNGKY